MRNFVAGMCLLVGCQMDEFKPEDELRPDPSDRRTSRSRKAVDQDNEPQLNIDDVEFDDDDDRRAPPRNRQVVEEAPELYEAEDDDTQDDEEEETRRPRKRQKSAQAKGPSRNHMMMGVGILALLLLVIGIGSALKAPSESNPAADNSNGAEKSIDLSGSNTNSTASTTTAPEANASQPLVTADNNAMAGQSTPAQPGTQANAGQDISLPPVSPTPTESAPMANNNAQDPQRRVELQGDLGNALTGQQTSAAVNSAASSSLPTQPATVAAVSGHGESATGSRPAQAARTEPRREANHNATRTPAVEHKAQPERQTAKAVPAVPKLTESKASTAKAAEPKVAATHKPTETAAAAAAPKAATPAEKAPVTAAPAAKTAPAATAAATAAPAAGAGNIGNVSALQSAPASNYTLQLSSSSNINNLNGWAKKENLQNYVVYQTKRNGQPWYVLVTGVYGSKDEAKRAVASLPAGVQAKNPWTKPIHQVQADLKQ